MALTLQRLPAVFRALGLLSTALLAACVASAEAEELLLEATESSGAVVDVGETSEDAAASEERVPLTAAPLRLLATIRGADPAEARATVLDVESNTIATYRIGDELRPSLVIDRIDADELLLSRTDESGDAGRLERLAIAAEPVALRPDYALYPDLAEEFLPHAMDQAVRLQSGPGYRVRTPAHAWATPRTVHLIQRALTRYMQHGLGGPSVLIGDLSRREGGNFPPHLSHHDGRDVDIGYILSREPGRTFATATSHSLDLARSWALIESFLHTEQVRYVFMDYSIQQRLYEFARERGYPQHQLDAWFQYPKGRSAAGGIIRDWPGHDDHFHVRFRG